MTRRAALAAGAVAGALAGAALLYARALRPWHMTWGATPEEAAGPVAGDALMPDAGIVSERASSRSTRRRGPCGPWLVQMGPGRGGAYTYDWIERRLGVNIRNVNRVVPELQGLRVGDEIPMPGYAMRVELLDRERAMVVRSDNGAWVWAFELRPVDPDRTRLVSRNRIDPGRWGLRDRVGYPVMEPGSWVMERKMLLTIKRLAEELALEGAANVPGAPPA